MRNSQFSISGAVALLFLSTAVTRAAELSPATGPTTAPTFPLSSLPPLPSRNIRVEQLQQLFPAFHHAPFQTAGYRPIQLPFLFEDPERIGNPDEALAMSFLMSYAMDWAPQNYCTRHAYFAFKRSPDLMLPLAQSYDKQAIGAVVQQWGGTHAMGGSLIKHAAGYSGKVMIFDRNGLLVMSRNYDKPVEFFDLLGDMCVDSMKYFGYAPSSALVSYLHERQCKNTESIGLLGSAAFMPERSPAEFAIYQKILDQDPDFGDVRYWWANQKHWDDNNGGDYMASMSKALASHLNISELDDYAGWVEYTRSHRKELGDYCREAEKLVGPDSPNLLEARLCPVEHDRDVPRGLPEQALRAAVDNPNQHWLVERLGKAFAQGFGTNPDRDMAASLLLCAATDQYLTGTGSKEGAVLALAEQANYTGHPDVAVALLSTLHQPAPSRLADLVQSLEDCGRFTDAANLMDGYSGHELNGNDLNEAARYAAVSAALAGRHDLLDRLELKFKKPLSATGVAPIIAAYQAVLDGQKPVVDQLNDDLNKQPFSVIRERYLLLAQLDQIAATRDFFPQFCAYADAHPLDRLCWFLYARYEQDHPSANGGYLLDGLGWSFPEDPWVQAMTKDRKRQGLVAPAIDLKELLGDLADYPPDDNPPPEKSSNVEAADLVQQITPWHIACAVHAALEAKDTATAREIAQRYRHATVEAQKWAAERFAAHLLHLCDQTAAAPAPTTP